MWHLLIVGILITALENVGEVMEVAMFDSSVARPEGEVRSL